MPVRKSKRRSSSVESRPPRSIVAISDAPAWVASACTRCGKCCTNEHYMGTLSATEADLNRWHSEGRTDILKYADVIAPGPVLTSG
jgi:hypothetical protein